MAISNGKKPERAIRESNLSRSILVGLTLSMSCAISGVLAETSQPLELKAPSGEPWRMHVIDNTLRKSEGPRPIDLNGDGLQDLVVAWENQEVTRIYLHPGHAKSKQPWPAVTIGKTPSVEDSFGVDLDGDGGIDVISCLEKDAEKVLVHWGPSKKEDLLNPDAWKQAEFPAVSGKTMWMYAESIRLTPSGPPQLVIGGKNYEHDRTSWLGLLIGLEKDRRNLEKWTWKPLARVSWVMGIKVEDLDGDGYEDILFSDKNGPAAGVWWLRNPGPRALEDEWELTQLHPEPVTGANFLTVEDLDGDGFRDILAALEHPREPGAPNHAHRRVLFLQRKDQSGRNWSPHKIRIPPGIAQSKGIAVGDIDGDGRNDVVISSTGAEGDLIGISWLRYRDSPYDFIWEARNISGAPGIKYDVIHLIDVDGDKDLDVVANDEKENDAGLGVIWYENPLK